jgi:hypothetical protein
MRLLRRFAPRNDICLKFPYVTVFMKMCTKLAECAFSLSLDSVTGFTEIRGAKG